jgi:hypothetical protein
MKNITSRYKFYGIVGFVSIPTHKPAGAIFEFQRPTARQQKKLFIMSRSFVFVTFQFSQDPPSSTSLPFFLEHPSADQAFSVAKKTSSYDNRGATAYGSQPLPVGHLCPFCSTARVDRVMGGAAYDRHHQNQMWGRVLPNNPPWQLF